MVPCYHHTASEVCVAFYRQMNRPGTAVPSLWSDCNSQDRFVDPELVLGSANAFGSMAPCFSVFSHTEPEPGSPPALGISVHHTARDWLDSRERLTHWHCTAAPHLHDASMFQHLRPEE